MLLVNHPKADELYNRMAEYKDFFLIAFFINVGLVGLPSFPTLTTALALLPLAFFKGLAFLFILSRFSMQPRTAYLSSLTLTNFSEFGLIVGVVGFQMGLISNEWIVTLAILMSLSFVMVAPLNVYSHAIFDRYKTFILRLNKNKNNIDSEPVDFGKTEILVIGLGSIGKPTYDELSKNYDGEILGLDYDHELIQTLKEQGYNVHWADTTDSEIWDHVDCSQIRAVYLIISDFSSNINTLLEINRMKKRPFKIFALSHYPDQADQYRELGVDFVFEYKKNLGRDFVNNSLEIVSSA
jgi:glutathione-regulated potassium-efflux system ancillary protein KefC